MLATGLGLTVSEITTPLRNARLVLLSLLANFVVMPLAAFALAATLRLDQPLGVGLLLLGTAAGAPFLPKLAQISKGNLAFGVGLMVLLMVVTVGYLPLVLPLLLPGVSVNPAQIARSLFLLMLLPLAGALAVRARFAAAAARTKPVLDRVSNLSLILLIVLITATNINNVLAVFGTRGILAALLFLAVGFGVGWLLGGPGPDTRRVLALGTAQRNIAAALVVGGQSFTDPKVVVMIIVVAIVGLLVLMPLSKALGRGSQAHLAVRSVGGFAATHTAAIHVCGRVGVQRHPSMNTVDEKKKGLKQTILHELIRYWLIVLYMAIFFGAFASYRRLLLAHYGISYEDYGIAVIRALVLAKVVLVAETLRLGRGYEEKPLIVPTLYKTFLFTVCVAVFDIAEGLVRGFMGGLGSIGAVDDVVSRFNYEWLSRALVIFFAFLPSFCGRRIKESAGKGSDRHFLSAEINCGGRL